MKMQRPVGVYIVAVLTLSVIIIFSFIQNRTSTTPPIDDAVIKEAVDRAKDNELLAKEKEWNEWLDKEKEWLAKEKERLERRKEQLERLLAQTQINAILLRCNGTTKYENEDKPVKGKEYNSETPVTNLVTIMDLRSKTVVFDIVANIIRVDHTTIFFTGIDDSNRITTIKVAGTIDGITGKVHVTSRFISHTDIPSSWSQSELICTPAKRAF